MSLLTRIRARTIGAHRASQAPPLPPPDGRCQASTRSGARCKLPGNPLCVLHRPPARPRAAA